jgi:hypothetical protein
MSVYSSNNCNVSRFFCFTVNCAVTFIRLILIDIYTVTKLVFVTYWIITVVKIKHLFYYDELLRTAHQETGAYNRSLWQLSF